MNKQRENDIKKNIRTAYKDMFSESINKFVYKEYFI